MKPETIVTEDNWVEVLAEYLDPEEEPLTISVREALPLPTQHALRQMRDRAPAFAPRVEEVTS